MTIPEPIRLKDLEGVLSSTQRGELAAYRQTGPGADLKLEMWENLAQAQGAEMPSSSPRRSHGVLRWWGVGVLCAALIACIILLRQKIAPEPPRAQQPVAIAQVEAAAPAAVKESAPSAEEEQSPQVGKPTRSRAAASVRRADALEELKLLTRARRVLPSRPQTSLALSREHAQLYPRGALAEEREVLAIEALLKLGRASEARQRARAFVHRFPDSSQRTRLDALLAQQP
jgi:hypothetical protein